MRTLGFVVIGILISVSGGCGGGPYRTADTARDEGYLLFSGARPGHTVYIDGVLRGRAEAFGGKPAVLAATPGLRTIEVRNGDEVIVRDRVFIGRGTTRTIDLP